VAPAVQITMPVTIPDLGTGSMTMIVGSATAALTGAPVATTPAVTGGSAGGLGTTGGSAASTPLTTGGGLASSGTSPGALGSSGTPTAVGLATVPALSAAAPGRGSGPGTVQGLFDIRSLYLMMAAGGLAAWLIGQLVRLLGVRRPWTSIAG
jgi:hypothetical protein